MPCISHLLYPRTACLLPVIGTRQTRGGRPVGGSGLGSTEDGRLTFCGSETHVHRTPPQPQHTSTSIGATAYFGRWRIGDVVMPIEGPARADRPENAGVTAE
jgi:hypothetical protein